MCDSAKGSEWLSKYKCENVPDSKGQKQKNKFYNEKVIIPISALTIGNIIKSLPEAPDFIDDEVSWKESGMKKLFFKLGFKSKKKHSNVYCKKCTECI